MKKLLIKYGDVAVGARDDFSPSSPDKAPFTNFENFKEKIDFPKYSNPCEMYSTSLDGGSLLLDEDAKNIGWWSEQITGEDLTFATPIVMTAKADNFYSSIGITLIFDIENNIYANDLAIQWYRGDELLSEKQFRPDSPRFFCENRIDYYDKIVIKFFSLNMPFNRLRLHSIEYGYGVEFSGDELKSVRVIQETSIISDDLPISPLDFELKSDRGVEFSFQDRQAVETYFNGKLRAKTFITGFKRKSKNHWSISTEDYIGLMETVPFVGGIYEDALAADLLKDVFETAKVPYMIQEGAFDGKVVSGYIPFTNCREALMQIAFAIGGTVATSNREDVYVYALSDELSQTIPLGRIMQGQNFDNETKMTAFELTAHQYRKIDDSIVLYEAEKSGSGEKIFVKFTEPIQSESLSITNGGDIKECGANYAIIDANEGSVLSGKKYEHNQLIKRKNNPLVLITDSDNIISIKDATLVSSNNIDNLLERCYNYYIKNQKVNLKIVEARHISYVGGIKYGQKKYGSFKYGNLEKKTSYDSTTNVGDLIEAETEYLGSVRGRIIKQSYNLNGNNIIKDTVMR